MSTLRSTLSVLLITSGFIMGPIATAQDFSVSYTKAELSTDLGVSKVYSRIVDTAKSLCEYQFDAPYVIKSDAKFRRCIRRTSKEYVTEIGAPKLARFYRVMAVNERQNDQRNKVAMAQK